MDNNINWTEIQNALKTTPIAPQGWAVWQHTYDGQPSKVLAPKSGGWSFDACKKFVSGWSNSAMRPSTCELSIEPVGGWETLLTDPIAALVNAIAQGLVPRHVAVAQIRQMVSGEPQYPQEEAAW